jgi:hypothetical protein
MRTVSMADSLSCPECGNEVESTDELEAGHDVSEIEMEDDGSISVYEKRDLFLCKDCKNPLGVSR